MAKNVKVNLKVKDDGSKIIKKFSKTTQKSFDNIKKSIKKVNAGFGKITKTVKKMALPVVALAGAFVLLTKRSLKAADAIAKTADKLGVSTDALQELRYAAELSGVKITALDMGLQRFTRRLAEARQGMGELKGVIEQYDISITNADGSSRSMQDVLGSLADVIANTTDKQERLRIAFKAFDSEGVALVNLLNKGAIGLEEFRQEAHRLGIVIEEDLLRQAEKANDAITKMSKIFGTTLTRAVIALSPEIIRISESFIEWFETNQKLIKIKVPEYIDKIIEGLEDVWNFWQSLPAGTGAGILGAILFGPEAGLVIGVLANIYSQVERLKKQSKDIQYFTYGPEGKPESIQTETQAEFEKEKKIAQARIKLQKDHLKEQEDLLKRTQKTFKISTGTYAIGNEDVYDYLDPSVENPYIAQHKRWLDEMEVEIEQQKQLIGITKKFIADSVAAMPKPPKQLNGDGVGTSDMPDGGDKVSMKELTMTLAGYKKIGSLIIEQRQYRDKVLAGLDAERLRKEAEFRDKELKDLEEWGRSEQQIFEDQIKINDKANERRAEGYKEVADAMAKIWSQKIPFTPYIIELPLDKMKEIGESISNNFTDAIVEATIATGQYRDNFKKMSLSVGADILRIATKMIFLRTIAAMFGGTSLGAIFGFKDGGITPSMPSAAGGNVFSGPKSGYLAQLHGNEAVIPLKNGAVPVALTGGVGGGNTVTINVPVTVQGGSMNDKEAYRLGETVSRIIDKKMKFVMNEERRYGGISNQRRR